uniref:Uncharacterized protein n=1 Tax=Candidatus Kentrum sp. FW TaxID=2126338 RepID=A0A450TKW9_9GAMM|nr:MAG: hypothetical protein BECKFW1821B_GA0114236_11432 [Candidatus Kentron sp. FW]
MPYQNIDASLSPADVKAVKDAFDTVLKKLPFLVNLTSQEQKNTFKAGPDSVSFVQNALTASQDNALITLASSRQLQHERIQERRGAPRVQLFVLILDPLYNCLVK